MLQPDEKHFTTKFERKHIKKLEVEHNPHVLLQNIVPFTT